MAEKVKYIKNVHQWAATLLEQTCKVTSSLPDIVGGVQANMQNNVQTLQSIHTQLVESRPISSSIIIGMILFYCLGFAFIRNGVVFAMCMKQQQ